MRFRSLPRRLRGSRCSRRLSEDAAPEVLSSTRSCPDTRYTVLRSLVLTGRLGGVEEDHVGAPPWCMLERLLERLYIRTESDATSCTTRALWLQG